MYVLIFTDKDHYEMSTWHKVRLELSLCLSLVEVNQALIAWLFRQTYDEFLAEPTSQ